LRYLRWYDDVILDDAGNARYLVAVGIDVTQELKASEALSRLNLQLEDKVRERTRALEAAQASLLQNEKMASIGTMVAGISHELNNPLMALTNYVDYACENSAGRTAEVLEKAAVQIRRIGKIVDGLLTFTRPSDTKLEQIDVAAALADSVELMRPEMQRHEIALEYQVPKDLPPALAEKTSLQQAYLNLLTNARDALLGQGLRRLALRGGSSNSTVWIEISDTGTGIPPKIRERVFDPFFTTKEPGQGTGLGLSVAQGIVRALGGTLTLEDQDTPGAVFRISLPRADQTVTG
jgi:C4-dicarboxylate-specific signal transduction histidine kinase